jgi:hypothetical protein
MYKKLVFVLVLFVIIACNKKTYDPGATSAVKVSNEWWVNLYLGGQAQYSGFSKIMTYNTAANKDSIWVDDLGNIWQFKIRAKFNADSLTFQAANASNYWPGYPIKVSIQNAKIMLNKAKSTTGVVTDSIYFKIIFSDDPTNTYEIKGTGRTMWSPDDH